jgi:parallel beta-helix repeat protein
MTADTRWAKLALRTALGGSAVVLALVLSTAAGAENNPPDTTPPTVSITSPAADSDLSGTVTVSADASDNVAVDHVTFQLYNGLPTPVAIGTASAPPYSFQFDSTAVQNCEHDACTVSAEAVDTSGNTATATVSVGIANPIVVDTTNDEAEGNNCSLREALASASYNVSEGGCKNGLSTITDTIDVPAGSYDLTIGELMVDSDVNIIGAGARSTVIDGGATGQRVFEITGSATSAGIRGVTIEGGSTSSTGNEPNAGVGGGIWLDSGSSLILLDSTITGNEADISGGGIDSDGSLQIIRSTIENNNTPGIGAGIDDFGPSLLALNSTILGNTAQGDGGGLLLAGPSTLTNDTIANNEAAYFTSTGTGGGIAVYSGSDPHTIYLTNTLLAGNTEERYGNLVADDCSTGIASLGHNLDDDGTCALTSTGDQSDVDPQLGPVDTSGPTDVLPLTSSSPAIDAGDDMACPPADQIGTPRPQGAACDIGAYEYVAPSTLVTNTNDSGPGSLRQAILNADAAGGGTVSFDIPGGGLQTIPVVSGPLPAITQSVAIDGTSQPGWEHGGPPLVALDGSECDGCSDGLTVAGGEGSLIVGLSISGFSGYGIDASGGDEAFLQGNVVYGNSAGGILVDGATGTQITANDIGTDGLLPLGNNGPGIEVDSGDDTTIGAGEGQGNVISGNYGDGIEVSGYTDGVTVQDNLIGLDASGTMALGNVGVGVQFDEENFDSTISRNVISGNAEGIEIDEDGVYGLSIVGNLVGTDESGAVPIGNTGDGILLSQTYEGVTVGGSEPASRNVVSGNGGYGIHVEGGEDALVGDNYVGTDATGTLALPNLNGGIDLDYTEDDYVGLSDGTTGNLVSGNGGPGITITFSDYNTIEGNSVGVDADGDALPNAGAGIRMVGGSNNTVGDVEEGEGNIVADNTGDGVSVESVGDAPAAADTIRGNSIHDNGGLGIDLIGGGNENAVAPTLAAAIPGDGSTEFTGSLSAADGTYTLDFYDSPSCDASGSGEGAEYLASGTVTVSGGSGDFDVQATTPSIDVGDAVTATATDLGGDTSAFSECVTAGPPVAGSLSGSVSTNGQANVDLTALGGEDWAVWGYANSGTSTSLAPDVRKAGGSGISDLTDSDPSSAPLRGLGQFGSSYGPFNFDWSDGNAPTSATGVYAGLEHDGQQNQAATTGDGFSFTVPADTTERTLTIFASEHWGTGTLTATLSDGSAAPYTQAVDGSTDYPSYGGNTPAVFTITYKAGSPGQHLTIAWKESAADCPAYDCDDAAIYAAALTEGAGIATGASATFNSDPTVEMSGSNDSISDIPLSAFEVTPQGITPAPINGLPINGLPINGLPINGLPINGLPINGLPINGLPINGLPINGLPINGLPINGLPINGLPINGLPINGLELPDSSWEQLLAGTPLANQPLQDITLQQVLALDPEPAALQNLTLGDLELADSALGQLTIGALVLGSTPINGLGTGAASIEQQLQTWCESVVTSGVPATDCSLANIGNQSLFALGLAGAPINGLPINGLPINGLPINGLPINGLPINGLDLSASPINGLPINGLPINGLEINGLNVLLSDVIDCSKVDCSSATTLGEAAADGAIVPGATYGQLLALLLAPGSPYKDTITLGDLIGLLIERDDVPWETLPPRLLSAFDPNRPTLSMTAQFTVQGSGSPAADVKVDLPAGFDYVPGSAALTENSFPATAPGDPEITRSAGGDELDWQFDSVDANATYRLTYQVYSGTDVGPAQATETVTAGSFSDSSIVSFTVADSFPSSSDPFKAPVIAPNQAVQMSALASPGAVEYFKIAMPAAGTRIHVHLTNLTADYDLALYSNQTTSVRTGATSAPPLQDGIVSDQPINVGGANGQLTPTALQDVPDPGIPVVQVSANRGTDDEDVGMVSPGGSGYVTIAVFGYNGAFSPHPFTLRVTATPPPATETCTREEFPDAGEGTTLDSLPDPSSLPSNLNTIILVDEKRLGDTYGSTDEANAVAKLHDLAGDGSLGVSGVVVPVETITGVQGLYDQWDSNPCNPDAANAVANAIANEVDTIVAARPSVKYVVFAGGDDQIPFFRLPDLSLIANESGFAGQFGPNEYQGSLAAGDLLSDDPYLDTNPVPASGQQLFPPNLAGGRLVETAQDIANAVTNFENAPTPGALKSSTGFVSGYDFVADGSQRIADNLTALGVNVRTLDDPLSATSDWSASDLLNAAFPAGGPADINSWNGHYDNYRAQMANGDVISTADLRSGLNGGIFFTMGCHAGFQTTDAVVGSSVLDWPQYFAEHDTGFVGNTGFGLGDTDSVAFSEELMSDFAANLGGSLTLGQALMQAKQQYYLSRVAFSNYDEKTLSEAELYGLPMYGVGRSPTALDPDPSSSPDPVHGATDSASPSQGPLSSFPGNGVQSASFSATPHFVGPTTGEYGEYFTNDGQVQAPNYRPLQPFISLPAARSGLVAHGVVIDGLTSSDTTPFTPDNVRPTLNSSGDEPPPTFTDEAWPEKIPTLVSLGADQSLNLITGQFFTQTAGDTTTGVERLWTQIAGQVTYSTSQDFTPPTIDSIDAYLSNGILTFSGRFSDRDQNGNPGTVVFAQVVYDDGTGHWQALPLTLDSSSGAWLGGVSFGGSHIQYFVEACDTAGNCGYSSNKGDYFDAQPLTKGTGGGSLTIKPSRDPDANGWYQGSLPVTVASTAGTVSVTVDGVPVTPDSNGQLTLSGDGAQTVAATDSAGNTMTAVYLLDDTAPTVATTFATDGSTYTATQWNAGCPTAGLCGTASDSGGSGVASVQVSIERDSDGRYWNGTSFAGSSQAYLDATGTGAWSYPLPASALDDHVSYTVDVRSTDNAGNTSAASTLTFTYVKTYNVTFGANGIPTGGSNDTGTHQVLSVTIGTGAPTTYTADQLPVTLPIVSGSSVSYQYGNPVGSTSSSGGLYILQNGRSLPSSPFGVAGPQSITATYSLLQAAPQTATVYANSTANPIDVLDGDSLAGGGLSSVQSPTAFNGTASSCSSCVGGGPGVSYAPYANYLGTDTFTYTITDASGSYHQTGTVTVDVIPSGSLDDSDFLEDSGFFDLGRTFNALFTKIPGDSAHLVLKNTDPPQVNLVATITNDSGVDLGPPGWRGTVGASKAQLAAIISIPGMPKNCNLSGVPDCSNPGGLGQPAFVLKGGWNGADAVHVLPDGGPGNENVTVLYKDPGAATPCSDTAHDYVPYASLLSPGVAKCVLITGISIPSGPHRAGPGPAIGPGHSALIDISLGFRPLNTIWPANPDPQVYFVAGLNFKLTKLVTVSDGSGGNPQVLSGDDNIPIVLSGKHVTAIGGYVGQNIPAAQAFGGNPGDPAQTDTVNLYNSPSDAGVSGTNPFGVCPADPTQAPVVGTDTLTPDDGGFYYIWETGSQKPGRPPLPWGVQYYVQVCGPDGHAYTGTLIDHIVGNKEFEEQDFVDSSSPRPTSLTIAHHDGKPSSGDTIQIAFSQPLDEASMCGAWGADNGRDQTLSGLTLQLNDGGGADDVLALDTPSVAGACGAAGSHFGSIDLGSTGYNTTGAAIVFTGSKIQWNHNGTLTVTLGTPSPAANAVTAALTATYTPDPTMRDPGGNPIHGTASDSQTGASNSNF